MTIIPIDSHHRLEVTAKSARLIQNIDDIQALTNTATNPELAIEEINIRIEAIQQISDLAEKNKLDSKTLGKIFALAIDEENFPVCIEDRNIRQNNGMLRSLAALTIATYGLKNQRNKEKRNQLSEVLTNIIDHFMDGKIFQDLPEIEEIILRRFLKALSLINKPQAETKMGHYGISSEEANPPLPRPLRQAV